MVVPCGKMPPWVSLGRQSTLVSHGVIDLRSVVLVLPALFLNNVFLHSVLLRIFVFVLLVLEAGGRVKTRALVLHCIKT